MPIYHVNSFSQKVVFRNEDDFLFAINRLAICAKHTLTEILAFCFLSTHFHLVVRTNFLNKFIETYKRSVTRMLNIQYGRNGTLLKIYHRQLISQTELIAGLNYVLKNPVHHNLCAYPSSYPYSSVNCYFKEEIQREDYFHGERKRDICLPSELDLSTYRYLFGTFKADDSFRVISNRFIDPESFVDYRHTCTAYSTVRNFIYNMNKPLKEELDLFSIDSSPYPKNENQISLACKLSDIDVCNYIDSIVFSKKIGEITSDDLSELWNKLQKLGVDRYQFDRCILPIA